MGSKSVTKSVAKKLKYYVDITRREDAFDLSGPFLPPQEPTPQRPGPTLAYDGIHDRSLKHYFRDPEVKTQVGKMTISSGKACRESEIRRVLDGEMSRRNYKLDNESQSPYLSNMRKRNTPPRHRPQALISVDEYLKTKKGAKQRKVKPDMIGKPRKAVRRSPPQFVSKNEHERLVNMAARLIAATETAALPGNRYTQTTGETSTCDSSQLDVQSFTGESTDTEISARRYPRPPSRAGDRRPPRWTPPRGSPTVENGDNKRKTLSKSSNNSAQSDTSENVRNQVHRRKAPKKNAIISPYKPRPATAGKTARRKPLEPSLQHAPYRPQSARFEYGKTVKKNGLVIGMNSSDDEMNMMNNDQKFFYKRSPKPNVPRIRTLTYQIYVLTGDCRGAGTEADIKLTLFGEYGTSGERPLLKSMNHPHKFRRGQVDIFPLDSLYLGELQNIRIGHSKTTPEHGWFLEKVYISEGKDSNRVFEFPCQRWFSSQKDDGQIVRDVSVSGLLAEPELNGKIDEYTSRTLGSSDEESDASYTSESSASDDDEKRNYSSENDDRTPRAKTKEATHRSEKDKKNKNQEIRKKTVSFEGEHRKDRHDSDKETKKSEDEYSSRSEKSDYSSDNSGTEDEKKDVDRSSESGGEKSEGKNSKGKSSEGNNSKGKSSGDKNSEDRNSKEGKSSEGENSKEGKSSEGENSKDKEKLEDKKEDDFWSASSDRGEPIHYDLGVEEEENDQDKDDSNHSNSPKSSRSSSSTSSRHGEVEDEKVSEGEEEIQNEKSKSERKDKEENADKQSSQESVRSDVKSDEDANKDYMAGFLAGVKATEHEKEIDKEDEQNSDKSDDDEDDEQYIMRKGPSLHIAVSTGNIERVQELIQHNPSLKDQTDEKGWIPLHVGCSSGQLECVKLIAVSGGNLEQETPTGYTSMHLAAMNGHVNCMMVLFALGAEISCRTIDEHTPLHLAAMSGHVECVKWLLANRAKHDVTDVNDRTPGDIAEEYCYEDVAKLLKSFKKELTRTDSTLSHLMTYEGKRRKSTESITSETAGTSSKVADSGLGGLASSEENWVSDNDHDEDEEDDGSEAAGSGERPSSGSRPASARRQGSARRPGSARSDDSSINRTDSITTKEEKQKLYEKQRQQMKKRNSSFLDSIRMDVEDDFNTNF